MTLDHIRSTPDGLRRRALAAIDLRRMLDPILDAGADLGMETDYGRLFTIRSAARPHPTHRPRYLVYILVSSCDAIIVGLGTLPVRPSDGGASGRSSVTRSVDQLLARRS